MLETSMPGCNYDHNDNECTCTRTYSQQAKINIMKDIAAISY